MTTETPNPGSDEAIEQGCSCPRMDNARGAGVKLADGTIAFWQQDGCPIHRNATWEALKKAVGA